MKNNLLLYTKTQKKKKITLLVLLFLTLLLTVVCVSVGSAKMNLQQVLCAFFGVGNQSHIMIVRSIRLPRVFAALLAGVGLSTAGCVMQTVLKNPMASPSTLGVSNASVFGANFAVILLGGGAFHSTHGEMLSVSRPYLVTGCAFVCALLSVLLILALSRRHGFSPETVVLCGVALGSLFTAGATVLQYFAPDSQVAAAVFWSFGDLGRASYREDLILLAAVLPSFLYFYLRRWDFNALANGEDTAKSLGVKTVSLRFFSLLFASVICAVCVSFLGIIGFVGLVAPQMARRFFGSDFRFLLPVSALLGACLLLVSDTLSRSVIAGVSLPVGAVTSLFGAPLFLWMLLRKKRGVLQ